jgi:proline-specific peptidase
VHDDHQGRLLDIGDTALWVVERGATDGYPLILLHGGPGDDHHEFGDYLDPLGDRHRLLLVDQRGQGNSGPSRESTWTLHKMAADVVLLAKALGLERYAVLGHSYGAFVALQNAIDYPGMVAQTIVSGGLPSSRYLEAVGRNLETFQPVELREQVAASWARETDIETPEEFAELMHDQMPFHFADPRDPRIEEYERRTDGARFSPRVLRAFAAAGYGGIDVEDRLGEIGHPVLILHGRHERTCVIEGAEAMAKGIPESELVIFEESAHMTFVEEHEKYLVAVRDFLDRHGG